MEIQFKITKSEAESLYNPCEMDMLTGLEQSFSKSFKKDLQLEELHYSKPLTENQEGSYTGRLITK